MTETSVQVRLHLDQQAQWKSGFSIDIKLDAHLTQREEAILFNTAKSCEVLKMLSGSMAFGFHWVGGQ
ncbi:MAG: hypothetical protein ABIK68_18000 [bacterium]